jgi:ubiquinone/menaquinone biosynthesis C-methylase UbiE
MMGDEFVESVKPQNNIKVNTQPSESVYFDFQAEAGMTKHLGGAKATDEMLDLCYVTANNQVLDVGCGAGSSACYIARKRDCYVTGVDIRPKMVERAEKTAASQGLQERTAFQVADAQSLPFEDNQFDVLLCQSVLAFVADKSRALHEFIRVTRPGGYIAFTEAQWRIQPEPDMQKFLDEYAGPETNVLPREEWLDLLQNSGLTDLVMRAYDVNPASDSLNQIRQTGCLSILGVWGRAIALFLNQRKYREFAKNAVKLPKELANSMSYGIYVGRKPLN